MCKAHYRLQVDRINRSILDFANMMELFQEYNMEFVSCTEKFDNLTGANSILISYANSKIEDLDTRRQGLVKEINELTSEALSPKKIQLLSGYLSDWGNVDFDDKRLAADSLISQIRAINELVQVEWKI